MPNAEVVKPSEWQAARVALLEKEKALTRANDAVVADRRALPMVEMTKAYTFTGLDDSGKEISVSFSDLFDGRRQLIMKHFMFAPEWDAGCPSCSLGADNIVALEHLHSRDTTFVSISRAPIQKITAYKERMGWTFPWFSSYGSDFNYDFHVTQDPQVSPVQYNYRSEEELKNKGLSYATTGEQPGMSCFFKGDGKGKGEEGKVYHTYSTFARGMENTDIFGLLDMTLLGRQGDGPAPATKRKDEFTPEELKGSA